ncbi:MAG: nitrate reductase subunit beta, partial [Thermocrispum sp.]
SLQRLAAMRAHMRQVNLGEEVDPSVAASVRLTTSEIESMYRLLAIAKYDDRYVIPSAAGSDAHKLDAIATGCSLDGDGGPGMTALDQMAEKFHLTDTNGAGPQEKNGRINLLNWDGKTTEGLFTGRAGDKGGAPNVASGTSAASTEADR